MPKHVFRSRECPYPGVTAEILNYLLEMSGIPYELVPIPNDRLVWGDRTGNVSDPCQYSGLMEQVFASCLKKELR